MPERELIEWCAFTLVSFDVRLRGRFLRHLADILL